jgi:hypothetical protein
LLAEMAGLLTLAVVVVVVLLLLELTQSPPEVVSEERVGPEPPRILSGVLQLLPANLSAQPVFMLAAAAGDSLPGAQEGLAVMVAVVTENPRLLVCPEHRTLAVAVAVLLRPTVGPVAPV